MTHPTDPHSQHKIIQWLLCALRCCAALYFSMANILLLKSLYSHFSYACSSCLHAHGMKKCSWRHLLRGISKCAQKSRNAKGNFAAAISSCMTCFPIRVDQGVYLSGDHFWRLVVLRHFFLFRRHEAYEKVDRRAPMREVYVRAVLREMGVMIA